MNRAELAPAETVARWAARNALAVSVGAPQSFKVAMQGMADAVADAVVEALADAGWIAPQDPVGPDTAAGAVRPERGVDNRSDHA